VIAAVDCGTNTIKLLIGDLPQVVVRESRTVRLGQGVDTTGELAEEALARTFAAVDEYAALIAAHPVDRIRFCATSATRDASNAAVFAEGVRARLGVPPEVLSGDEEAALAFDGAVRNLRAPAPTPVLVVDIGGGSTELVLGSADGVDSACSLDIGSVRLHERHLHDDPPSDTQIDACRGDIDAQLDGVDVPLSAAATVVGVAGSVTTVAAGVLDLAAYDPVAIDQSVLRVDAVGSFISRLLAMTVEQRRALPYMAPGRADVIGAGALILERVLNRTATASLVVSESDILDGIAWSMVEPRQGG
jgi:exopolyphosphatase / guanosine-5'-triphosphate,3'-diphosphate pyrophosphatase